MKRFSCVVAIVLLANGLALVSVVRNGRGPADATVTLTEREMTLAWSSADNSGMTLLLNWDRQAPDEWFDCAKLTSVGFDCPVNLEASDAPSRYGLACLPRRTYIVLDYDPNRLPMEAPQAAETGGAGQGPSGAKLRPAEYRPRLRPIDVGSDPDALRARYPDGHRYIVTAGIVRTFPNSEGRFRLKGRVAALLPNEVYVPRELQPLVTAAVGRNDKGVYSAMTGQPRYEVTVEYGRSLLPKIVAVRKLAGGS